MMLPDLHRTTLQILARKPTLLRKLIYMYSYQLHVQLHTSPKCS